MIEKLQVRIPAGAVGKFSSPELTLCADSYSVSVPPHVLPLWHVKDPSHPAKSARGRLHQNTHTLDQIKSAWADYAAVQVQCGNLSGNKLTRNLTGSIQPQLSQLAEPLWTDPGIKSGISVHELIST